MTPSSASSGSVSGGFTYSKTVLELAGYGDARVTPGGSLGNLPKDEIDMLLDKGQGG